MAIYSRRQLLLLLALLGAGGVGLAVERWRAAYPEVADRLERLDRAPEPPTAVQSPAPDGGPAREPAGAGADPPAGAGTARAGIAPGPGPRRGPAHARSHRAAPGAPVDLNRAGVEELEGLPGVGPVLAERIVARRRSGGGFASVDDLRKVPGVGPAKLDRLRPLVTVGPVAPAPGP